MSTREPVPPAPSTASWPPDDRGGTLGDGRFASETHHPRSVAEIQALVRAAVAQGLAVYPQGGGTALDAGGEPGRPGVAIRLDQFHQILDYPAADMTITVESGVTLGQIRALVAEHGQRLAIEAAHPDRATLGGIFATASTGPRRFGWGRPRDGIIGVGFVASNGELIRGGGRVVKNVAGYDLPKLLTGSWGTLGIITELTLKVNPRPEASALVTVACETLAQAAATLAALNTSGTRPVALELVDDRTKANGRGSPWTVLVGLEGNATAVDWQIERLAVELNQTSLPHQRDDAAKASWLDFVATEAQSAGQVAFAASFAPSRAVNFVETIDLDHWSVRVHAGNGVIRGLARWEGDEATFAAEIGRLRARAAQLDGALILTRCPTAWKRHLSVWGPPRPDWAIAERVKLALDPDRVLNPGRFIGTI